MSGYSLFHFYIYSTKLLLSMRLMFLQAHMCSHSSSNFERFVKKIHFLLGCHFLWQETKSNKVLVSSPKSLYLLSPERMPLTFSFYFLIIMWFRFPNPHHWIYENLYKFILFHIVRTSNNWNMRWIITLSLKMAGLSLDKSSHVLVIDCYVTNYLKT